MKVKAIKLSDGHPPADRHSIDSMDEWNAKSRFRVESVSDSIEFHTGEMLSREQVQKLCDDIYWKVTVVKP